MSGPERTVMFQLPTVVSGQLVCVEGSVAGRSWELSAGTFVIGRQEDCDLHLSNEPGVSKVHCKIVAEGNSYRLIDAESRNGTIVNGAPTQTAILSDGDLIQVCGCKLRFTQTGRGDIEVRNPPPPQSPAESEPIVAAPAAPPQIPTPATQVAPTSTPLAAVVRDQVTVPAPVQVRGSTLVSFFTGLFLTLIAGAGAYLAVLLLNGGQLPPPPGGLVSPASAKSAEGKRTPDTSPGAALAADAEAGGQQGGDATKPGSAKGAAKADEPSTTAPQVSGAQDAAATQEREKEPPALTADETKVPAAPEAAAQKPSKIVASEEASSKPPPAKAAKDKPSPSRWFTVSLQKPARKPVRVPSGGRVKSVDVSNGDTVTRRQVLARVANGGGNSAQIATKKESIRALESIVEASGDPAAEKLLREEKAALKQIRAMSRRAEVTAPISGTLEGFRVKAGETLRSRLVVGFVKAKGEPVLEVMVPRAIGNRVKKGQVVELKTAGGTEEGRVKSKQRRGKRTKIVVVAGEVDLSEVTEARLP